MKKYIKTVLIFTLGIFLTNCSGEDGLDGLAGEDGNNGVAGADGTDGFGFDALTEYGSISSNIVGTRADGVPFTDESEFIFVPMEFGDFKDASTVVVDGDNFEFQIERFSVVPDDYYGYDRVVINLDVIDAGLPTQSFDFNISFDSHLILGEDLNYFIFDESYDYDDIGVSNFSVTDYSFNEQTYELNFSYSLDVSGAQNDTGNNLAISGSVAVLVLEDISNSGYDEINHPE